MSYHFIQYFIFIQDYLVENIIVVAIDCRKYVFELFHLKKEYFYKFVIWHQLLHLGTCFFFFF
jgi:hypothetical protein